VDKLIIGDGPMKEWQESRMASEHRQMLVGLLKFVVFILCIILIPYLVPAFINLGTGTDVQIGICLLSWVVALGLQWALGKALDPWVKRQTEPKVYQGPYPPGYPPPQPGYQGQPVYNALPQYYAAPPATPQGRQQYQSATPRENRETLRNHVCKRCGGPVNLTTKKCELCGSRN